MAKRNNGRGKGKAGKAAARTAPAKRGAKRAAAGHKRGNGLRAQATKWVGKLSEGQLKKLLSLREIVEDPCTCERIPPPVRGECEWLVKWENSGA